MIQINVDNTDDWIKEQQHFTSSRTREHDNNNTDNNNNKMSADCAIRDMSMIKTTTKTTQTA